MNIVYQATTKLYLKAQRYIEDQETYEDRLKILRSQFRYFEYDIGRIEPQQVFDMLNTQKYHISKVMVAALTRQVLLNHGRYISLSLITSELNLKTEVFDGMYDNIFKANLLNIYQFLVQVVTDNPIQLETISVIADFEYSSLVLWYNQTLAIGNGDTEAIEKQHDLSAQIKVMLLQQQRNDLPKPRKTVEQQNTQIINETVQKNNKRKYGNIMTFDQLRYGEQLHKKFQSQGVTIGSSDQTTLTIQREEFKNQLKEEVVKQQQQQEQQPSQIGETEDAVEITERAFLLLQSQFKKQKNRQLMEQLIQHQMEQKIGQVEEQSERTISSLVADIVQAERVEMSEEQIANAHQEAINMAIQIQDEAALLKEQQAIQKEKERAEEEEKRQQQIEVREKEQQLIEEQRKSLAAARENQAVYVEPQQINEDQQLKKEEDQADNNKKRNQLLLARMAEFKRLEEEEDKRRQDKKEAWNREYDARLERIRQKEAAAEQARRDKKAQEKAEFKERKAQADEQYRIYREKAVKLEQEQKELKQKKDWEQRQKEIDENLKRANRRRELDAIYVQLKPLRLRLNERKRSVIQNYLYEVRQRLKQKSQEQIKQIDQALAVIRGEQSEKEVSQGYVSDSDQPPNDQQEISSDEQVSPAHNIVQTIVPMQQIQQKQQRKMSPKTQKVTKSITSQPWRSQRVEKKKQQRRTLYERAREISNIRFRQQMMQARQIKIEFTRERLQEQLKKHAEERERVLNRIEQEQQQGDNPIVDAQVREFDPYQLYDLAQQLANQPGDTRVDEQNANTVTRYTNIDAQRVLAILAHAGVQDTSVVTHNVASRFAGDKDRNTIKIDSEQGPDGEDILKVTKHHQEEVIVDNIYVNERQRITNEIKKIAQQRIEQIRQSMRNIPVERLPTIQREITDLLAQIQFNNDASEDVEIIHQLQKLQNDLLNMTKVPVEEQSTVYQILQNVQPTSAVSRDVLQTLLNKAVQQQLEIEQKQNEQEQQLRKSAQEIEQQQKKQEEQLQKNFEITGVTRDSSGLVIQMSKQPSQQQQQPQQQQQQQTPQQQQQPQQPQQPQQQQDEQDEQDKQDDDGGGAGGVPQPILIVAEAFQVPDIYLQFQQYQVNNANFQRIPNSRIPVHNQTINKVYNEGHNAITQNIPQINQPTWNTIVGLLFNTNERRNRANIYIAEIFQQSDIIYDILEDQQIEDGNRKPVYFYQQYNEALLNLQQSFTRLYQQFHENQYELDEFDTRRIQDFQVKIETYINSTFDQLNIENTRDLIYNTLFGPNVIPYITLTDNQKELIQNLIQHIVEHIQIFTTTMHEMVNIFNNKSQLMIKDDSYLMARNMLQKIREQIIINFDEKSHFNREMPRNISAQHQAFIDILSNRAVFAIDLDRITLPNTFMGPQDNDATPLQVTHAPGLAALYQAVTGLTKFAFIKAYLMLGLIMHHPRISNRQRFILQLVYDPQFNNRYWVRGNLWLNPKPVHQILSFCEPLILVSDMCRQIENQSSQSSFIVTQRILSQIPKNKIDIQQAGFVGRTYSRTMVLPNLLLRGQTIEHKPAGVNADNENLINIETRRKFIQELTTIYLQNIDLYAHTTYKTYLYEFPNYVKEFEAYRVGINAHINIQFDIARTRHIHFKEYNIIAILRVGTVLQEFRQQEGQRPQFLDDKIANLVYTRINFRMHNPEDYMINSMLVMEQCAWMIEQLTQVATQLRIEDNAENLQIFEGDHQTAYIYFNPLSFYRDYMRCDEATLQGYIDSNDLSSSLNRELAHLYDNSEGFLLTNINGQLRQCLRGQDGDIHKENEIRNMHVASICIERIQTLITNQFMGRENNFNSMNDQFQTTKEYIKQNLLYTHVGSTNNYENTHSRGLYYLAPSQWGAANSQLRSLSDQYFRDIQAYYVNANCSTIIALFLMGLLNKDVEIRNITQEYEQLFSSTKLLTLLDSQPHMILLAINLINQGCQKILLQHKKIPLYTCVVEAQQRGNLVHNTGFVYCDKRYKFDRIVLIYYNHHIEISTNMTRANQQIALMRKHIKITDPSVNLMNIPREYILAWDTDGFKHTGQDMHNEIWKQMTNRSYLVISYDLETTTGSIEQPNMQTYLLCYNIRLYSGCAKNKAAIEKYQEQCQYKYEGSFVICPLLSGAEWTPSSIYTAFLDEVCKIRKITRKSLQIYIAAHNGGKFDTVLMLRSIIDKWGSLVSLGGTKTDIKQINIGFQNITFVDSRLMTQLGSLNAAASSMKINDQKHPLPREHFKDFIDLKSESREIITVFIKYCIQDVVLLSEVIHRFNQTMIQLTKELYFETHKNNLPNDPDSAFILKPSLPATAFKIFVTLLIPKNQSVMSVINNPQIYDAVKCSQYGGRTSVFRYDVQKDAHIYDIDICSSYPNQMSNNTFASGLGIIRNLQAKDQVIIKRLIQPYCLYGLTYFQIDASVGVMGYFPIRCPNKGVIYYPTEFGDSNAWYNDMQDLYNYETPLSNKPLMNSNKLQWLWGFQLLSATTIFGDHFTYNINFEIKNTGTCKPFVAVGLMYEKRKQCKLTDKSREQCYKLFMNGFYGYMGMKDYPQKVFIPADSVDISNANNQREIAIKEQILRTYITSMGPDDCKYYETNGTLPCDINLDTDLNQIVLTAQKTIIPRNFKSRMVHFVSQITAHARDQLNMMLYAIQHTRLYRPLYCDTDSVYFRSLVGAQTEEQIMGAVKPITVKGALYRGMRYERTFVLQFGSELGQWSFCDHLKGKNTAHLEYFVAYGKKFYWAIANNPDGTIDDWTQRSFVKHKGQSSKDSTAFDVVQTLLQECEATYSNTQWRRGKIDDEGHLMIRQIPLKKLARRTVSEVVFPDGSTRPFKNQIEKNSYDQSYKTIKFNTDMSIEYI